MYQVFITDAFIQFNYLLNETAKKRYRILNDGGLGVSPNLESPQDWGFD
jgi:hypothetical protein